jgi:hypothetical protein
LISSVASGLSLKSFAAVTSTQSVIAAVGSVLLLAGLWTPATGFLVALEEAWKALSLGAALREATSIHAFLAVLSLSVAMLGPGAWSIDARVFGRKRFDVDRMHSRKSSQRFRKLTK